MNALSLQTGGSLESHPFSELLIRAHDEHATGTLVLEEPNGVRHGVYFEAGVPERAKTPGAGFHLGEVLLELGCIDRDAHRQTLAVAQCEGLLHGTVLLGEGMIDRRDLELGLREQLTRQVAWLFGQPLRTRYGYFARQNFLLKWGAPSRARVDLLETLWRGIRDHARPFDVEHAVARLAGRRIVLAPNLPRDHFAFLGEDRAIVEDLRGRTARVVELLRGDSGFDSRLKRLLYFLLLTRSVELGVPSAPPLGLKPEAPPSLSLPPSARVPGFSTPYTAEARTSSLPPPPSEPPAGLSHPEGTREFAHLLGAELAFQRAEAELGRGNVAAARQQATVAFERDPDKPQTIALRAYLDTLSGDFSKPQIAADLKRALRLAKGDLKVHWYRALALKRLGHHEAALSAFRYIVAKEPNHIDAAREVRLYTRASTRPVGTASDRPSPAEASKGWYLFKPHPRG